MAFNSLTFIFAFLPLTLAGWWVMRRTRFENHWMLVCSLYFYAAAEWWWLLPFFASATLDYYLGNLVYFQRYPQIRRKIVIFSIVFNLVLLGFFKYTTWITTTLAAPLSNIGVIMPVLAIGLPAGISFYTFQSLSYTIDIYRKEFKPIGNVVDYLAFVAFFPHLVAGPIMRARDLLPQIAAKRPLPSAEMFSQGMFMILFGLFVKIVLADHFGGFVEALSNAMTTTGKLEPGLGFLYGYAFAGQIYCDFMAYSTIAWGAAKLFNVNLMHNFLTPYFAVSPSDFWRRWHVSLSTWLRDYLYIPLGGNRISVSRTQVNLMLTMLLGGIWHGASIMFVFWGLWHGLLLVFYRWFPIDEWLIRSWGRFGRIVAMLIMFHLVCFGWILFRASWAEFPIIMQSIWSFPGHLIGYLGVIKTYAGPAFERHETIFGVISWALSHIYAKNFAFFAFGYGLVLCGAVLFVFDSISYRSRGEFWQLYPRMGTSLRVLLMLLFVYSIILIGRRQANDFIYFAF